jgi:hypothetical protein
VADAIGVFANLQTLARALGGEVSNGQVLAPGPGHSTTDRSLSVMLDAGAPDGFVVNTFSPADDPIVCMTMCANGLDFRNSRQMAVTAHRPKTLNGYCSGQWRNQLRDQKSILSQRMITATWTAHCFTRYSDWSRRISDNEDQMATVDGFGN